MMESTAAKPLRAGGWVERTGLEPGALAWAALAMLMAGAAAFLYHETRQTTLWFDEWDWVFTRRGGDLDVFLDPHNGHLSLIPVAIYKLLFATAGLDDYVPYRVLVIGAHLVCVALVFVYVRRRVEPLLAVLAAALLLFVGPAWQTIVWPFQVAWLISLAAGVGALLLLERRDRLGDVAASGLLALSLAASGLGLPIGVGLAVDVLWGRRRWRDVWIAAVPLALYGVWWLTFQETKARGSLLDVPGDVVDSAAAALAALAGLGDAPPDRAATLVGPGRLLLAVALAAAVWRLVRLGRVPPRVITLLTMVVLFWGFAELSRGRYSGPETSRYLYVGGLFAILIAAELTRGVSVRWPVGLLLTVLVAAAALSNLDGFRDAGRYLRDQAQLVRAELGALEVAEPLVERDDALQAFPGFFRIAAGPYFDVAADWGTPADSPAELLATTGAARGGADRELIQMYDLALKPASPTPRLGPRPVLDKGRGVTDLGPCLVIRPGAASTGGRNSMQVTVPPGGLLLRAQGGTATVGVRRFGDVFERVGRLRPSVPAELRIAPDRARVPWHVEVLPVAGTSVCGLR